MSRAIASARQRRAGVTQPEQKMTSPMPTPPDQNGLTLPQVIALIDTRLIKLERFMKESTERSVTFASDVPSLPAVPSVSSATVSDTVAEGETEIDIGTILDDFNSRFMMLAEEIASLKDTLMKLQSYTMDVNKMLLEERVSVLSDLGNTQSVFVLGDTNLPEIDSMTSSPPQQHATL